eukprot:scaffold140590_cov39-Cyclotella_meneghiniana.AAC.1
MVISKKRVINADRLVNYNYVIDEWRSTHTTHKSTAAMNQTPKMANISTNLVIRHNHIMFLEGSLNRAV